MSGPDGLEDPARVRIRRRIEWMDTDAAGIYHWSTAFRLAEAAEAELHTALGIADRTFGATPRVSVAADFRRALRFNDPVEVDLVVQALGRSSVTYRLLVTSEQGPAVEGRITAVLVDPETGRALPWPEDLRAALAAGGAQAPPGFPPGAAGTEGGP